MTVGETPAEAWFRMYNFERACSAQTRAMTVGRDALHHPLPGVAEKTDAVVRRVFSKAANELAWPALLRRLDREAPDFRT